MRGFEMSTVDPGFPLDGFGADGEREAVRAHLPEARLMEQLAQLAIRTRDDAQARALIGALVPLAARMVPAAEPALLRAAPQLMAGLAGTTGMLRAHPATRPLVGRLPTVARCTGLALGRRAAAGRPTSPDAAMRVLAGQAVRVLGEDPAGEHAGGAPAAAPPAIVVSAGYPNRGAADRRTAGTGGIRSITFDISPRKEQIVTITGRILSQTARRGLENTLRPPEQVASLRGRHYDRAHLWGRQFGDEAAAGVMYAPAAFNTGAQRVFEDTVKGLRHRLGAGQALVLRARATSHAGYPFVAWSTLRKAEYVFTVVTTSGAVLHRTSLRFDVGPPTDPKVSVQVF